MEVDKIYNKRYKINELQLRRAQRIDKLFTFGRISSFVVSLLFFYLFFINNKPTLVIIAVVLLVTYIVLTYFDAKFDKRKNFLISLKDFLLTEQNYLNGIKNDLPQGEDYIDRKHEYTYDLDIFGPNSIFQAINRAVSQQGKDKLAEMLRFTQVDAEIIKKRQVAVDELSQKTDWRFTYQAIPGALISSEKLLAAVKYNEEHPIKFSKVLYISAYLLSAITLTLLVLLILGKVPYQIFTSFAVLQLTISFYFKGITDKITNRLDSMQKSFSKYYRLLCHIDEEQFDSELINDIKSRLFNAENSIKAFKQLKGLSHETDQRNNIFGYIVFNSLFMLEIHLIGRYQKWMQKYSSSCVKWVNALSEFDAISSISGFKFNHPNFKFPQVNNNTLVTAVDLGHPLIPASKSVSNKFEIKTLHKFCIVTGANMAGKSTFLRTVGTNLVIAAIGAPVCASSFEFTPMQLFSSMRTSDDLADSTSYFQAELVRLGQMINCIDKHPATFVILDEILKGTNSEDKLNGSRLFLDKLVHMNASGIIATHDLALGKLETEKPNHFFNTCFEIDIEGDDIIYDYKLKIGITKKLNATMLINKMLANQILK